MTKPTIPLILASLAIALSAQLLRAESTSQAPTEAPAPPTRSAATDRALFDIGVMIGSVEERAAQGAAVDELAAHLGRIKQRAAASGAVQLPWTAIDALIDDMASAQDSRDLHGRIVQFRNTLALKIARQDSDLLERSPLVTAEPPSDPFDCDPSSWEGVWDTSWGTMTLVFDDGRFYGTYGSSQHALSGTFNPDEPKVLRGVWHHFGSTSSGGIRFEMKAPGRFVGGWSWQVPVDGDGSSWNGSRQKNDAETLVAPIGEATIADLQENGVRSWSQSWLIKNVSGEDFWIYGYSADFPFIQVFTQAPGSEKWQVRGLGYCGTGASFHRIPRGSTFTVTVSLPEEIARRKVVVEFRRHASSDGDEGTMVRIRSLQLVPPTATPRRSPLPHESSANEGQEMQRLEPQPQESTENERALVPNQL